MNNAQELEQLTLHIHYSLINKHDLASAIPRELIELEAQRAAEQEMDLEQYLSWFQATFADYVCLGE